MSAWALLADLEARGGRLVDRGGDIRLLGPRGLLTPAELETLRAHKPELLALLRSWPPESADCVERFGRPEARLYPLLKQRVSTLYDGPGLLVSVITGRAAVVLDRPSKRCAFLPWQEVAPLAVKGEVDAAA